MIGDDVQWFTKSPKPCLMLDIRICFYKHTFSDYKTVFLFEIGQLLRCGETGLSGCTRQIDTLTLF